MAEPAGSESEKFNTIGEGFAIERVIAAQPKWPPVDR
jgi:hypothetical protein